MEPIQLGRGDTEFIRKVEEESRQVVKKCYQCGNCTAGCPMSFSYDYTANQLMRLIQLGQRERVLKSRAVWMCVTCETCTTRCPNEIDVARVLDVCRHMARKAGYGGVFNNMRVFADSFLQTVRWNGKSHELGLMALFKMRAMKPFSDLSLAPSMLLKGKLPYLPHRIKGRSEVAGIFKRFSEQQLKELHAQTTDDKKPAGGDK
ncbi:MAG: 4Fe-4S dicluster domain-containing protein [Deltaproteobacteria bacterium]|jgi:heterodisulfide reductase subunit C|nr:4Fe-4S dicluster domain-containing protein [Deltaproteobacteria bacterium]